MYNQVFIYVPLQRELPLQQYKMYGKLRLTVINVIWTKYVNNAKGIWPCGQLYSRSDWFKSEFADSTFYSVYQTKIYLP